MIVGVMKISDDWEYLSESYIYKTCTSHDGSYTSFIGLKLSPINGNWSLYLSGFPEQEYSLVYPEGTKIEFNSLEKAEDHVDRFLIKLNNLKVFL